MVSQDTESSALYMTSEDIPGTVAGVQDELRTHVPREEIETDEDIRESDLH